MPSDVINEGGEVISSSQQEYVDQDVGERMPFMLGIILSVFPSDNKNNTTGKSDQQNRGTRHECLVLAGHDMYSPDVILSNVIIPPCRHSGMDNYEEDLPRGCSQLIDGALFDTGLKKTDYGKLDGEWCVLGFVNGSIQHPFIIAWWPHPSNAFDPATSGNAYEQKSLVQCDTNKNRSRSLRMVNGTLTLVNRDGSVYLDTTQASRKTIVKDGKLEVTKFDKGGHIQVDVKKTAQLEINFNEKEEKGPRIGAGSTSDNQVHDSDLPHPDQPIDGTNPKVRSTKRTLRRSSAYETLEKTSSFNLFCENTEGDGKKGEAVVLAEDTISLTVKKGSAKGTMIAVSEGKLQIWSNDGTQINILNDDIQIVTKSGALIRAIGPRVTVGGPMDVIGPLAVGGPGGQPVVLGTGFTAAMAPYLAAELVNANENVKQFGLLATACAAPPLSPLASAFTALATSWGVYAGKIADLQTTVGLPPATNPLLAKATASI